MMKYGRLKMKNKIFSKTVILSCVIAVLSFFLFSYEINHFEDGILDVVATSQDGYVRLVLDQINLKENREDEEIVNNILSTLDASNNKYWTFSKGDTIIFVKDVLETEKYKSFTASTYYQSMSSQQFYDELTENKIIHQVIHIGNHNYIASGTVFTYNGTSYKLALLSNEDAILENNTYLKGKTESYILYYCSILILLIMSCALAWKLERSRSEQSSLKKEIQDQNKKIIELNNRIFEGKDQNVNVWDIKELPLFVNSFSERGIREGKTVEIIFSDEKSRNDFVQEKSDLLPDDVICFTKNKHSLVLLVIYETEEDIRTLLQKNGLQNITVKNWRFSKERS